MFFPTVFSQSFAASSEADIIVCSTKKSSDLHTALALFWLSLPSLLLRQISFINSISWLP